MKKEQLTITFPFLIHRNEDAIERGIAQLRAERIAFARRLQTFVEALTQWYGMGFFPQELCVFLFDRNHEPTLLKVWKEQHDIPQETKLETLTKIYAVPDYSGILSEAGYFSRRRREEILSFFNEDGVIDTPELTAEEKEKVVMNASYYVFDLKGFYTYQVAKLLCEAGNKLNFDLYPSISQNRMTLADLKRLCPEEARYISFKADPDQTKKKFLIDYEAFMRNRP